MLILTRRIGEVLTIGDDIKITICSINHGQVRIGIDAPRDIVVDRLEIHERKRNSINREPL